MLLSEKDETHATEIAGIKRRWTKTGGVSKIVAIHRVQNLHLHKQYEAKKAELKQAGKLSRSDVRVYHGTRVNLPSLIHSGTAGFDPSRAVASPG